MYSRSYFISLFWCFLKQLVGSERKRLRRHRPLVFLRCWISWKWLRSAEINLFSVSSYFYFFKLWRMRSFKTITFGVVSQMCSVKKAFLRISQDSQETPVQSLFLNIVAGVMPATLLKKRRLWHTYFLVNFAKFSRTPFFIEHLWWLFQHIRCFFSWYWKILTHYSPVLLIYSEVVAQMCSVKKVFLEIL